MKPTSRPAVTATALKIIHEQEHGDPHHLADVRILADHVLNVGAMETAAEILGKEPITVKWLVQIGGERQPRDTVDFHGDANCHLRVRGGCSDGNWMAYFDKGENLDYPFFIRQRWQVLNLLAGLCIEPKE